MSTTGLQRVCTDCTYPSPGATNERTIYQQLSGYFRWFDQGGGQVVPTLSRNFRQQQPVTKSHDFNPHPHKLARSHPPHQHGPATEAFGLCPCQREHTTPECLGWTNTALHQSHHDFRFCHREDTLKIDRLYLPGPVFLGFPESERRYGINNKKLDCCCFSQFPLYTMRAVPPHAQEAHDISLGLL